MGSAVNEMSELIAPAFLRDDAISIFRKVFAENHYVRFPGLFAPDVLSTLQREAIALQAFRTSRDFLMPGYNTSRRMHTIGGKTIRKCSSTLISLYENTELRDFLAAVSSTQTYPCAHPSEFMVLNFLETEGATHGWHVDDPQLAFVVVLEAPQRDAGGILEFIPAWSKYSNGTSGSRQADLPGLVAQLRQCGVVRAFYHVVGDTYLLKADECLHRVTPLCSKNQRRVVLNLAFETALNVRYGETANLLYD